MAKDIDMGKTSYNYEEFKKLMTPVAKRRLEQRKVQNVYEQAKEEYHLLQMVYIKARGAR